MAKELFDTSTQTPTQSEHVPFCITIRVYSDISNCRILQPLLQLLQHTYFIVKAASGTTCKALGRPSTDIKLNLILNS